MKFFDPKSIGRYLRFSFLSAVAFISIFLVPGFIKATFFSYPIDSSLSEDGFGRYVFFKHHLEKPFHGYGLTDVFIQPFGVIALSNMACGMVNVSLLRPELKEEIIPLLHEILIRALSKRISSYNTDISEVERLGDEGMYLSHLNIILGCYRYVSYDKTYDALHQRITQHLAFLSLNNKNFHAPSFPSGYKFPADQAVTLFSLFLYDQIFHEEMSSKPIAGWLTFMRNEATDETTGLHHSSVSDLWFSKIPRGCALSWTTLYMAQFVPNEARDLYAKYRQGYFSSFMGWGGFREWPQGKKYKMNIDSGPIIMGIGLAATGFGVGPSRLFNDQSAYQGIMRSADTFGFPLFLGSSRKYLLSPLLGEAILFHGQTSTFWFQKPHKVDDFKSHRFAIGPLVSLVIIMFVIGFCLWRIKKMVSPC